MDIVSGFLGWLFDTLSGMFSGLVQFLGFNPLASLPNPINSELVGVVGFINRFIPIKTFFQALALALPWFVLLVVAGIIWRWVKGL